MSTITPEAQAEIDRRVAAALAGQNQQQPPQQQQPQQGWAPPQQGWAPPQMQPAGQMQGGPAQPMGVLVPVEITGPDGSKVTTYLQFGPQFANPQALMGLISSLMQQGVPIRAFAPKQQGWGGNGGGRNYGGYNRGGYGNNGGGGGWR